MAQPIYVTHPQLGLQNPCGGDCEGSLALAGAPLRPRQPKHARAAASYFGAAEGGSADRWSHPSGHFSASR
eukprot:8302263-Pyramimonas_sp.AAC.1